MFRLTLRVLPLVALLLGGCGEPSSRRADREAPEPAHTARPDAPAPASPAASTGPEDVVRLWLDAAKRGDAEAMSALYTEALRSEKVTPESYAADVQSAGYRAISWTRLREEAARNHEERSFAGHVVFRGADGVEHPENLAFRLVQDNGRWRITSIADYD
jgi:hypothetical protein